MIFNGYLVKIAPCFPVYVWAYGKKKKRKGMQVRRYKKLSHYDYMGLKDGEVIKIEHPPTLLMTPATYDQLKRDLPHMMRDQEIYSRYFFGIPLLKNNPRVYVISGS